jgi:hypothetical protein
MAGLPLWQLLNRRQPFADGDPSGAAQLQQSSGQVIGQSLIDFWNRAAATASQGLQDEPYCPPAPAWSLWLTGRQLPQYSPSSAAAGPTAVPPGESPIPPADAATVAPIPSTPSASPSAGPAIGDFTVGYESPFEDSDFLPQFEPRRTIGDFTLGSESPFEDSEFLPQFEPSTSDKERNVLGDFSKGRHDPFVNFQIDSLRKAGCIVESHVPLGVMNDPRTAIADWMHKCFYNVLPVVGEGKTGLTPELRRNQPFVYEQVAAGNGTSSSPKVRSFGLIPGTQFPPLQVMRSWSPWHGAPIQNDYPFGGAP